MKPDPDVLIAKLRAASQRAELSLKASQEIEDALDRARWTRHAMRRIRNIVHSAIRSAVSENNEACAKVADTDADQENVLYVSNVKRGDHERANMNEAARDAAHAVAETIRSREADDAGE